MVRFDRRGGTTDSKGSHRVLTAIGSQTRNLRKRAWAIRMNGDIWAHVEQGVQGRSGVNIDWQRAHPEWEQAQAQGLYTTIGLATQLWMRMLWKPATSYQWASVSTLTS